MNRTQLASCCLIASAFCLAGLIFFNLDRGVMSSADAALVIKQGNLTMLTAQTRNDEDGLFIIDNQSGQLLIFINDTGRGRLELLERVPLAPLFADGGGGGGGGNDRRGR